MLSFLRVALVMASIHSTRTLRQTLLPWAVLRIAFTIWGLLGFHMGFIVSFPISMRGAIGWGIMLNLWVVWGSVGILINANSSTPDNVVSLNSLWILASFLFSDKTPWQKNCKGGRVYLHCNSISGKSKQGLETASDNQEPREINVCLISYIQVPLYTCRVQGLCPGNGATHSVWAFSPQLM